MQSSLTTLGGPPKACICTGLRRWNIFPVPPNLVLVTVESKKEIRRDSSLTCLHIQDKETKAQVKPSDLSKVPPGSWQS